MRQAKERTNHAVAIRLATMEGITGLLIHSITLHSIHSLDYSFYERKTETLYRTWDSVKEPAPMMPLPLVGNMLRNLDERKIVGRNIREDGTSVTKPSNGMSVN